MSITRKRGFFTKVLSYCWKWFSYWKSKPVVITSSKKSADVLLLKHVGLVLSSHRVYQLPVSSYADKWLSCFVFSHSTVLSLCYRVNWVKRKICTTSCKHNQFTCLKDYKHLNKKVWFWPLDLTQGNSLPNPHPTATGYMGWQIEEFEGHIIDCPEEQAILTGTGLVGPPGLRCPFGLVSPSGW